MADLTLGLDLGSRAVKAVLLDPSRSEIIAVCVRDATADKARDADGLLRSVLEAAAARRSDIVRIAATGYGRIQVRFADETPTEIACHASGVRACHTEARAIIEIGGQDSKAIRLAPDGRVKDFAMNDRCAAGSGRFLEVAARILGTDLEGLAAMALRAAAEPEIGSTCVVFAESEMIGMLARGFRPEDLAAGIHRSIGRRVAGLVERIGACPPIVFTGGVALNKAMAAALGQELKERLIIPPDPRITGALGAALIAARQAGRVLAANSRPRHGESSRGTQSCASSGQACGGSGAGPHKIPALARFDRMVSHAIEHAEGAKAEGRKIVSIFCEFTPRELILAAGAVPVCACGGSHETAIAAERDLPANLCPLIKSSYGFALEKANPIFEMSDLVVAETTCDGKKKMFERLQELKTVHVLELPQKPDDEGSFLRWKEEIVGLRRRLEELTGNAITDAKLRKAIRLMNRERALRREIARLAGRGLTGREVLDAKSLISGIPEDLAAYESIIAQAGSTNAPQNGRPSVLLTGVPTPHGAEKVLDIIEAAGATVRVQETCTGLKPLLEDVAESGDPLEAIARKYYHLPCSCMTPNTRRMETIDRLIGEFHPRGVIDLVWQACLTYDVESAILKRHLDERHGLPYLKIVTDYSPSDTQQLRLRIEAFIALIA
ncbi:MAG TPA: double-cubane-cluster-containing anaerobic reductase [Acidobacteriota bacterium]|nr:double-cubane-cluster-containing anaerobic reductase [Acidobacteriota bacterium]